MGPFGPGPRLNPLPLGHLPDRLPHHRTPAGLLLQEYRRYLVPVFLTRMEIETFRRWAKRINPTWDERDWLSSALSQGLEEAGIQATESENNAEPCADEEDDR